MSTKDTLVRSFMAGAILALAAFLQSPLLMQTGNAPVGAVLFPSVLYHASLMKYDL
jgi:hypothetical protein